MPTDSQALVLDNLTTAVLLLGDDLCLQYLNPAAESLLGLSAQRVQGKSLAELVPNDAGQLIARVREVVATGHSCAEREKAITFGKGHAVTLDCSITPLHEGELSPVLLEFIPLDRQLRIFREEHLLTQQAATRAMVRGLAHEIKNPLGGLRGAAQLLAAEVGDATLREYTRIIMGEADRLHNLVDRLLGPNNLPNKRELCIHEVLEHVRNLVGAEAPAGVSLEEDYDPSIPLLHADRDLLVQAFLNLARNALQALGEAGVITFKTRILRQYTIGHSRHRLVVKTDVIDNGPGISPEMRERIFYPLVTGHDHGSGIGLSVAQSLVNQHDGLIECSSQPGYTEFQVLIPVETDDERK